VGTGGIAETRLTHEGHKYLVAEICSTQTTQLTSRLGAMGHCLADGALLRGAEVAGVVGAVDKETDCLALRNVVEGDKADVGVAESALAGVHLRQHLVGVVATEHG
jgi:hypothetical protein